MPTEDKHPAGVSPRDSLAARPELRTEPPTALSGQDPTPENEMTTEQKNAFPPVIPVSSDSVPPPADAMPPGGPDVGVSAVNPAESAPMPLPGEIPSRYAEAKATEKSKVNPSARGRDSTPQAPRKPVRPHGPVASTLLEVGPADRLFQGLSRAGLPVLLALTALMCVAELLLTRPLWFSDEVRHADVYMRMLGGDWLALTLNGVPYPDKPPLYFWFLRALDTLPGVGAPMLFFLGTALSAMLFIGSIWLLARATGHDRRVAFAAGLLATGCFFFAGLAHYPRMDLLFAAVITLALICLYRGWIKKNAPLWLTFGFTLTGVATLIKGPLALAFPILSSILFLIWRGTPGRLNGRDGLPGFALMLLMLLGWMATLYFQGQADYLKEIFGPQIAGRMVNAWHHAAPWWYYLVALPLVCLPWTFLVLFVNWWGTIKTLPDAWKRRREDGGRGWLWIVATSGILVLSAVSGKIAIYLLPLMPAMAVLAARALLNLTPRRSRWFFLGTGAFLALLGIILALTPCAPWLLPFMPESWTSALPAVVHAYLGSVSGLGLMGVVLLITATLLLFFTRRSLPGGSLLLVSLGTICMTQPYALIVAPSLDAMLSPRTQSVEMARYVAAGYFPAAYRVYPGIYAYYLNNELARMQQENATSATRTTAPKIPVPENSAELPADTFEKTSANTLSTFATDATGRPAVTVLDLDEPAALDAMLTEHPRAVIALREKDWNKWENRPVDIQVVQRRWIVDQPYVLVVQDRIPTMVQQPAPVVEQTPDRKETLTGTPNSAADLAPVRQPAPATEPSPETMPDAAPGIPPNIIPDDRPDTTIDSQPPPPDQPAELSTDGAVTL